MTRNMPIHVIWDFPMMLFNAARGKFRMFLDRRAEEEGRWING